MVIRILAVVLWLAVLTVTLTEGRSLHSRALHKHQARESTTDEDDMELATLEDMDDMRDLAHYWSLYHTRHRNHLQMKRMRHHHKRHPRYRQQHLSDSDLPDITKDQSEDYDSLLSRDKRHNRRKPWTDKDRKSFVNSRSKPLYFENEKAYEVEVREAQNSSLCNYTVIPIPDSGGRIPRDLEHVKCNHVGSKCQDKGTYCCIQTYRNVEVMYPSGRTEIMKVYSGCVCSLQIYGTLDPYIPDVNIDD